MATYAAYRHVELDRVGMGKRRVLKPPGGGSSISFGEDEDNMIPIKAKSSPPMETAPMMNDNQAQESPKAETNGTSSPPQSPKDNVSSTATKENNPSTATTTTTTTTNGVAINGTVTNGTSTSGSSTPNSSRLDTQSRLFGEQQPQKETPSRRIRDHHRSNIFTEGEDKTFIAKTANPNGTPEPKTPENKVPEQPQPQSQQQQRQRVPPGGFSTKLW